LTEFFAQLAVEEKSYVCFHQDLATVHAIHESLVALGRLFGDRIISCGLWPAQFYLWGNLKYKVCRMNLHSEDELKGNI
jgi:hypothetical protein